MMSDRIRRLVIVAAGCVLAIGGAAGEGSPDVKALAWMAGSWAGQVRGVDMEEHWLEPRGGMMLGVHRDLFASGKVFFEYLRIEPGGDGLVLVASPRGQNTTEFALVELGERRVVFSNPEHDFPQRVIYSLEDGKLCARIEGEQDGETRATEWRWSRVR